MNISLFAEVLWGNKARFRYLFFAACILLFSFLAGRDLWTLEHRWAEIVSGMFYRNDFLHPWLGKNQYYDKPLLSYWFIVLVTKLIGEFSAWSLRLPSAFAGLVAIFAIYRLGKTLQDKSVGFLASWMLLTTYYFVFWARTSSADMLNLAGSLFAVSWYIQYRSAPSFLRYAVFFMILAMTSLCKGLIGATVPVIVVAVDIVLQKSWRQHLRLSVIAAMVPAVLIYLLPFYASHHFGSSDYNQNGLYMVYKENVLRYFQPFDHKDPFYTYFIYLPIYLLPWSIFFIAALIQLPKTWKHMTLNNKWVVLSLLALFLFFSLSGSRRSYYVLPMVPFAILFTADWLLRMAKIQPRFSRVLATTIIVVLIALFLTLDLFIPWFYQTYGIGSFYLQVHGNVTHH